MSYTETTKDRKHIIMLLMNEEGRKGLVPVTVLIRIIPVNSGFAMLILLQKPMREYE